MSASRSVAARSSPTADGLLRGRARVRPGVSADEVVFANLGYADWATESYAVFRRLKEAGAIPADSRFQVDIPSPRCGISWVHPDHAPLLLPAYALGVAGEATKIAAVIPHHELSVQWSTVEPIRYEQDQPVKREARLRDLARLASYVPHDMELGYHLCYGDFEGKHVFDPSDLAICVEMANGLTQHATRRID